MDVVSLRRVNRGRPLQPDGAPGRMSRLQDTRQRLAIGAEESGRLATAGPAKPRAVPTPAGALGGGGGVDDWHRIWSGPIRDAGDSQCRQNSRRDRAGDSPAIASGIYTVAPG